MELLLVLLLPVLLEILSR